MLDQARATTTLEPTFAKGLWRGAGEPGFTPLSLFHKKIDEKLAGVLMWLFGGLRYHAGLLDVGGAVAATW